MTRTRLATLGWIATATIVLLYAPMAAEFTARLFTGSAPRLWDHTYSAVAGADHATGAGSIHAVQSVSYAHYRWVMLVHTTLGALAISLSVFQLSRRSRRRLAVHRWVGRTQGTLVLVAMPAAMLFLLLVGPAGTFDGPAFYLQLWALAIGTLSATLLGWAAVRRGHQATHRILMTYAFALLCTAPFLRVGYLVFGFAWRDSTQLVTNLAGAALLAVWAPMAAILASRRVPVPRRRDAGALPGPALDRAARAASALGVAALGTAYVASFDGIDRITVTAVVANLLGLLLTGLNLRASTGDPVAHEEWRIHHSAMLLGAPATALLWAVYRLPFSTEQAFYGAVLTGPALTLSLGLVLVAARRRSPVRSPAESPVSA